MKALTKIISFFDRVIDIFAFLAALLLLFMMLSVTFDVFMRFFFNRPQAWTIEFAGYSLLYITFLGTAWVLKKEGHVIIDIILDRLNPRNQNLFNIIISVIGMVISLILVWYGTLVTLDHFRRGVYFYTVLETPTAPILAIIPVGSFLLFIQFARRTYSYVQRWKYNRH